MKEGLHSCALALLVAVLRMSTLSWQPRLQRKILFCISYPRLSCPLPACHCF
jgi:hypothetical protein